MEFFIDFLTFHFTYVYPNIKSVTNYKENKISLKEIIKNIKVNFTSLTSKYLSYIFYLFNLNKNNDYYIIEFCNSISSHDFYFLPLINIINNNDLKLDILRKNLNLFLIERNSKFI